MQKNHEYHTTSAQYYAKDSISDDEYFLIPSTVTQVPHAYAQTTHYGLKNDSMYGSGKYEDHHNKNFHVMNHHDDHNKGHHVVPEVYKKVHFVDRVEIDKNGKREFHDQEISVDIEADGFIQKHHQTFDKWETFKTF